MNYRIRESQEKFFRSLYNEYKGTPMSVSSESINHKKLRYKIICDIFKEDYDISVHDVGMGIADLNSFIQENYSDNKVLYSGTEILNEYVTEAQRRFPECIFYNRNISENYFEDNYDYILMSGVFHQMRDCTIKDWEKYSLQLISNAFKMCKKGIAFNFISPYVDFYQPNVYYCNLPKILNFIKDDLSRFFEIKHNYALFEFTVYVFKEEYINSKSPETEFQKYFKTS